MDLRIQRSVVSNLLTRPKALEIGPFVAGLDPETESPFINYASPVPGSTITAADVTALVAAFTEAGRKPRLEYVTSCAPGLEALLLRAGFTVEARNQYLICSPSTLALPPVPGDFELVEPQTDLDRAAVVTAQNEAFGDFADDPSEAAVARLRRCQERGGVVLGARTTDAAGTSGSTHTTRDAGTARDSRTTRDAGTARDSRTTGDADAVGDASAIGGQWVGGGQANPPNDGLSEVAGIAVRESFRRRGLGAAISAGVTRRLFDRGVEFTWLEASGDDSWRVYERIGYVPSGHRLYISSN